MVVEPFGECFGDGVGGLGGEVGAVGAFDFVGIGQIIGGQPGGLGTAFEFIEEGRFAVSFLIQV